MIINAVSYTHLMELIAIVNLRKQSENYNNAFWFTIAGIVLGLFAGGDGLWGTAISILHGLATLGATYYICTATEECVSIVSYEVADYCHSVCNWYVTCMVISLAISVVTVSYTHLDVYKRQGIRKLNSAYAVGGGPLLVSTIESNYRIDIDNYASVDFSSMANIIDLVGGVDLEVSTQEAGYINMYLDEQCRLCLLYTSRCV